MARQRLLYKMHLVNTTVTVTVNVKLYTGSDTPQDVQVRLFHDVLHEVLLKLRRHD
jgi:hypothetical protein